MDIQQETITSGADVVDSDGERLGSVIAATAEYMVVEQGFFIQLDFYIPRNVIDKIDDAIIYLTITKQHILTSGWTMTRTDGAAETA